MYQELSIGQDDDRHERGQAEESVPVMPNSPILLRRGQLEAALEALYTHWRNEVPIVRRVNGDLNPAPNTEALSGLDMLLVEDIPGIACLYGLEAALATGREINVFLQQRELQDELVDAIRAKQPRIALVDGLLARDVRGWNLVKALKVVMPNLICIGFSSDEKFSKAFRDAGAEGFVLKRMEEPTVTMQELATEIAPFL
jgi:hypothetical protein